MKNPFVMMAVAAAAMMADFRDKQAKAAGYTWPSGGRTRNHGPRSPAGGKRIRAAYRAKFGSKADFEDARDWYRALK